MPHSSADGLFGADMLRELRAQARLMELDRIAADRARARPARVAERERSRTAFSDLTPAEASRLATQQFPGLVQQPSGGPLSTGATADRYVGRYSAVVEGAAPGGEDAFVVSGHPLRMRDETGEPAPVDTTLVDDGTGWTPANPLEEYAIDPGGGLTFLDQGISVDVASVSGGTPVGETLFFPDTQADTDTLVKPGLDGAQYAWQLRSQASPETLRLDFELDDATLGPVTGEGVEILRDGERIGVVTPAVAFDADLRPVPAKLRVEGTDVLVDVSHRGRDIAYPVMVDPEVMAGFYFTHQGNEASAWPIWEIYDNGRMDPWGGDGPYGRGLHIASQDYPTYIPFDPGTGLGSSEQAGIVYNAPGQARIYKVTNSSSMHISGEALAVCMVVGIAHAFPGGFQDPYGYAWGEGCAPFAQYAWTVQTPNGAAANGNRFIFGAYAYSAKPTAFQMYFKDAEIRMYDEDAPTVTQVNAPDEEWLNGDHAGGLRGFATDASTGVKSVTFSTGSWSRTVTNPKCAFGPCSRQWDNGGSGAGDPPQYVPVAELPEGRRQVSVVARDPAGNTSPAATIGLSVDRSGPPAPVFKPLAFDSATQYTHVSWSPSTDGHLADGTPGSGTVGYRYRYSTGGGAMSAWEISASPIFSIPGTVIGQSFDVQVQAIDMAGNYGPVATNSGSGTPPADTVAPTLELGGALYTTTGETIWDGYWDLDASATDAGSGVAEIAATVDGAHMTFAGETVIENFEVGVQGQICGTAGCSLDFLDIPFDTREYAPGTRTVTVTAKDFAGNTTTRSFTIVNSHQDPPEGGGARSANGLATIPTPGFTAHHAGAEVAGLPFDKAVRTAPEVEGDVVSTTYLYGTCDWRKTACAPPLQVQSSPIDERNVSRYAAGMAPPRFRITERAGVPAASFEGGRVVELYTGDTTVSVMGEDPEVVREAVDALRVADLRDVPSFQTPTEVLRAPGGEATALEAPASDPTKRAAARSVNGNTYQMPRSTYSEDSNCGPSGRKDPINVAFIGSHATGGNVRDMVAVHGLKWKDYGPGNGGTQYIIQPNGSACTKQDTANSRGFFTKHHSRNFSLVGQQHNTLVAAVGVHRDVKTRKCGGLANDAVPARVGYEYTDANGQKRKRTLSGFNIGQREFLDAYPDRHQGMQQWPSTSVYMQCDPQTGDQVEVKYNGIIQFFALNADY